MAVVEKRDLAWWVALFGGAGKLPKAPGTWGSLAAMPLAYGVAFLPLWGRGLVLLVVIAAGTWAAEQLEQRSGQHDSGEIVIDEVAGVLLTFLFLTPQLWWGWLVGFGLFRFFDILKPWPVGMVDKKVGGGWGVMLDDLLAGGYAGLVLWMVLVVAVI